MREETSDVIECKTDPERPWVSLTVEVAPPMWAHFPNFFNVQAWPYLCTYPGTSRPQYRSCELCGGDAMVIVARESMLTGIKYSQAVCSVNEMLGTDEGNRTPCKPLFVTEQMLSYETYNSMKRDLNMAKIENPPEQ